MKVVIPFLLLLKNVLSQTKYPQSSLNITGESSMNITDVNYFVESTVKLIVDEKNWFWKPAASCWRTDTNDDVVSGCTTINSRYLGAFDNDDTTEYESLPHYRQDGSFWANSGSVNSKLPKSSNVNGLYTQTVTTCKL